MRKHVRFYFRLLIALLFVCSLIPYKSATAETGKAAEVCAGNNCFPDSLEVHGEVLPCRGAGTKVFLFFRLYDGAFYVARDVSEEEVLGPVPKALVLRYRRHIPREKLIEAAEHNLQRNPDVDMQALSPRIDQMHALYQTVEEGDEYRLYYSPEKGTELYFNGELQGTIPGDDFAQGYFGVWLSDHVFCKKIRNKLLAL